MAGSNWFARVGSVNGLLTNLGYLPWMANSRHRGRNSPMHINTLVPHDPRRALIAQLIGLAEDTDRAGLREQASMLVAMAYAVADRERGRTIA